MNERLTVAVRPAADHCLVIPRGPVYADTVDPLRDALAELLEAEKPRIILDLSEVRVCDSSGLNLLVNTHHAAAARGGSLRLTGTQPMVRRVMDITNLSRMFAIHPSVDDALADDS